MSPFFLTESVSSVSLGGAETFEEWEVDAQAAISGSGMSLEEQSGFLINKREGDAKRDIICMGGPGLMF